MNNEQTVSVPRERLREFIENAACLGRSPQWVKNKVILLDALAQPAAQHQGEPVMKLEAEKLWGGAGEYAVSFVKAGWLQECRAKGGTFLLYTHADTGEVERLRAQIVELEKVLEERDSIVKHREEMLEKVASGWPLKVCTVDNPIRIEHCGQVLMYSEDGRTMLTFDPENMVLGEPVDEVERWSGLQICSACVMRDGRPHAAHGVFAEPSAPVERDERADFERFANGLAFRAYPLEWFPDQSLYGTQKANIAWQAWQARAALERKP